MSVETRPISNPDDENFETAQVAPIVGAHFIHDLYTAGIPALLPVIIEKLTLTLTQAGMLTVFLQLPAMLNPFIGYMADRVSLRYFVILAPGLTATFIGSLSFADSYFGMALLLLAAGVSVAMFHAPAPAMIARVSGKQVGLGMSLFMAAGELARTIGPLLAVWAVTMWTFEGYFRIMLLGWATSLILFWRLKGVSARTSKPDSFKSLKPFIRSLFLPLALILFTRNFMMVAVTTYLPTFMIMEGADLWLAGISLSILEIAAVGGALLSGTISDRMGRKNVLLIATIASSVFLLIFLNVEGWLLVPVLLLLGFTALSTAPVMLAIVQDQMPNNRALGNGLFLFLSFLLRSIATLMIGLAGDNLGLETAYYASAVIALGAIPGIMLLPRRDTNVPTR